MLIRFNMLLNLLIPDVLLRKLVQQIIMSMLLNLSVPDVLLRKRLSNVAVQQIIIMTTGRNRVLLVIPRSPLTSSDLCAGEGVTRCLLST